MAKKMMLIDANFVGSNGLRSTKRHYSALDQNVSDVLERTDISDYDKLKLYQHATRSADFSLASKRQRARPANL